MRKQTIFIDLNKTDRNVLFTCKQKEDLLLHLVVNDKGEPYMIGDNDVTTLYILQNEEVTGYTPDKIVGNDLFFLLNTEATKNEGLLHLELSILDEEGMLKSKDFFGLIQRSIFNVTEFFTLIDIERYILLDSQGFTLQSRG